MRLHELKVFGAQHWNAMKNFFLFERCIKSQLELQSLHKQGITNTLALPIDKMLYIYLLRPHSEHPKKICSNLNSLNTFTKETGSNKVKLSKVGSNMIVHRDRAQQRSSNNLHE
jgi:hypothetical protein